jgi:hypothetical protein
MAGRETLPSRCRRTLPCWVLALTAHGNSRARDIGHHLFVALLPANVG